MEAEVAEAALVEAEVAKAALMEAEVATLELERLKADNANQKQLIDTQNQEMKALPKITDGDVPDMAAELRDDLKAIKAQLDDLKAIKEAGCCSML